MSSTIESIQQRSEEFRQRYAVVREQIGRVIVGHDDIVHGVLTCMLEGGHCLLEGVPGLGKTMLVRTMAEALNLKFNRVQFTLKSVKAFQQLQVSLPSVEQLDWARV